MQIAKLIVGTEAEGPGKRAALWLQGCPLRCPGCCNPEMLKSTGGQERTITSLVGEICQPGIEGLSLLGGEPFAQAASAVLLAEAVQRAGLSLMIFSGYTLVELQERNDCSTDKLLDLCDLLVDGPYLAEQPEEERRWIGSRNQVMHFLSDRYSKEQPMFRFPNSVEIRWQPGTRLLTVSGWPSASDAMRPPRGDNKQ